MTSNDYADLYGEQFIGEKLTHNFDFTNALATTDSLSLGYSLIPSVTGLSVTTGVSGKIGQVTLDATSVTDADNSREVIIELVGTGTSGLKGILRKKVRLIGKTLT